MNGHNSPTIPVSWGELVDKITILELKQARIFERDARANVEREHRLLRTVAATILDRSDVAPMIQALRAVNEALWDVEDAIRGEEAHARFAEDFIRLARSVYKYNDERAAIKRRINALLESDIVEEKSYVSSEYSGEEAPAIVS